MKIKTCTILIITILITMIFFACKTNSIEPESDPLELSFSITHVSVFGGSNGAIDLTVIGGKKPYAFEWSNGEITEDISNLSVGAYSVIVTDALSDQITNSFFISEPNDTTSATVTDVNGNVYQTVKIGDQWWMAENLKATHSIDSNPLSGVYAFNNEDNIDEYGRFYTWESAINACPLGWHLPTSTEWDELISNLGSNAADKLKDGGSSGFNAKMAGYYSDGSINHTGNLFSSWTSTESGDGIHSIRKLIIINNPTVITDNELMNYGLSVRCTKD